MSHFCSALNTLPWWRLIGAFVDVWASPSSVRRPANRLLREAAAGYHTVIHPSSRGAPQLMIVPAAAFRSPWAQTKCKRWLWLLHTHCWAFAWQHEHGKTDESAGPSVLPLVLRRQQTSLSHRMLGAMTQHSSTRLDSDRAKTFAARKHHFPGSTHQRKIPEQICFVYCFVLIHQHNYRWYDGREVSLSWNQFQLSIVNSKTQPFYHFEKALCGPLVCTMRCTSSSHTGSKLTWSTGTVELLCNGWPWECCCVSTAACAAELWGLYDSLFMHLAIKAVRLLGRETTRNPLCRTSISKMASWATESHRASIRWKYVWERPQKMTA